jgi:hypothetical protein
MWAAWCVLFASAHLYWALGGTVGFVAATGSLDLLKQTWFVVVGLWGVALVCLAGALVCLATVLLWGRRVPSWLLRTVLWIGVVVLLVRALPHGVQDVLLVTGAAPQPTPGLVGGALAAGPVDAVVHRRRRAVRGHLDEPPESSPRTCSVVRCRCSTACGAATGT